MVKVRDFFFAIFLSFDDTCINLLPYMVYFGVWMLCLLGLGNHCALMRLLIVNFKGAFSLSHPVFLTYFWPFLFLAATRCLSLGLGSFSPQCHGFSESVFFSVVFLCSLLGTSS